MRRIQTPKKASHEDWHPADIVCALRKAGWSLRGLSLHHGYHPHGLMKVTGLTNRYGWPKGQQLIADAIGVPPWEIWPSRYTAEHLPIGRPIRPERKHTQPRRVRNGSGTQGE